ncbi:hypothetical protein JTB14_021800 [Gonioctena quinquepunctata]|nr:hypothetical protein JTB14_021800 [Gonioctena quinquepunctata]
MNSKNDLRKDLKTNIIVPNKAMPTARTTSSECEVHSIPQLHLDPIYDNSNKKLVPKKGRIMIVSGHYARNLASFLNTQTQGSYEAQSLLIPNAPDAVLMETALKSTFNFTKRDLVILWPNRLVHNIINEFIHKLENTNVIIITEPFIYNKHGRWNEHVYKSNLAVFKALHHQNLQKHILESNNILRKSNLTEKGNIIYLNKTGAFFLSKGIICYMESHFQLHKIKKQPFIPREDSSIGGQASSDKLQKQSYSSLTLDDRTKDSISCPFLEAKKMPPHLM